MSDSQREGRFQPGESGNPNGRPKGAVNNKTKLLQEFCDDDAPAVWRKIKEFALAGHTTAMRILADRTLPVRRERTIEFDCPEFRSHEDVPAVLRAIANGCLQGDLAIADAHGLVRMLEISTHIQKNILKKAEALGETFKVVCTDPDGSLSRALREVIEGCRKENAEKQAARKKRKAAEQGAAEN